MANSLDIKMQLPTDAELNKMFNAVPALERHQVMDKVLTAGSRPVVRRARQLAPRSSPEDRAKRSSSQQTQQSGIDWNYPLWKTIGRVVRKYSHRGVAVIGPKSPRGNKVFFNVSPKGRRQVLWGNRTGRVLPAIRNFIAQAFDETKTEQLQVMKTKLKEVMADVWRK